MMDGMTGIRVACTVATMTMTWLLSALLAACAAGPTPAPAPVPAPASSPPASARENAERWVAAEGLGDRMYGPDATIGIGSASLGKGSASNPDARRMAARSAELKARGAIARARGERVAAAADASGSASVTTSTDLVSLRGVSVIQTEEVTDPDGSVKFAVVVRADPPAAPAVVRLDVPPAQWAKSIPVEELARSSGARRVAGPDGVVHIMAFGQATAQGGRDAMAREKARMRALAAIRQFIDEDVSASSAASEQSTRAPDGGVALLVSATMASETSSSRAMVLPPTLTAFQWRMPTPDGNGTVGVVLLAKDPAAPAPAPAPATTNAP